MANTGYQLGADLIVGLMLDAKFSALGHSTTCQISHKSETKDRSVKPTIANKVEPGAAGLWKEKVVTGLSVQITASGFVVYDETETPYDKIYAAWESGSPITARWCTRGAQETSYHEGQFIISELSTEGKADDDVTYSITLDNSSLLTDKTGA